MTNEKKLDDLFQFLFYIFLGEILNLDGQSFVIMKLFNRPIISFKDEIRLKFRTNYANGVIIYSKGTQGDLFSLRLNSSRLILSITLGEEDEVTSLLLGSLLDDNSWHNISIKRTNRDLKISFDGQHSKHKISGYFERLDLNNMVINNL